MEQVAPAQVSEWLKAARAGQRTAPVLLDVREPWEFALCHIDGATLMPMAKVPEQWETLDPTAPTVVVCHHGMRSFQVGVFLERQGFASVINLHGGIAAWADQVDPTMATY